MAKDPSPQIATFAMGCFWGPQYVFSKVPGVISTKVGYTGGKDDCENPSYEEVCGEETGHAEAVEIEYDSDKVSYKELLGVFWSKHDPTQVDRQGPDVGTQYRSVIFYHNEKQKVAAMKSKEEKAKSFKKPIATQIVPATTFYRAEDYHQQYLEKRGLSTCHI